MKKQHFNLFSCFAWFALLCFSQAAKAQSVSFSINPQTQCFTGSNSVTAVLTATQSGATSYSWSVSGTSCTPSFTLTAPNGSTAVFNIPCVAYYTITCYAMNSSTVVNTTSQAGSVLALPVLSIFSVPNGSMCSGNSATLSVAGAVSYTWIPASLVGPNIVVSPTANTCYTVLGISAQGCVGTTTTCLTVVPMYTPAISGNTNVCVGSSSTLNLTGGPSFVTNPGNINSTTPVLSPSVSMLYSITCPAGAYACPNTVVIPIVVNPMPTLAINANTSPTICAGKSVTLTAIGNSITYTWSTLATTNSIVVSPLVNTCYTVIGSNASGCNNTQVQCVTVLPTPTLTVTGTNSVCLGSSTNFTASGASTYTWSTTPIITAPTVNILPTASTIYTVAAFGSNGCMSSYTFAVFTDTTCSMVWPGDANSDGIVDNTDVLELGLAASSTGPVRTPTSIAYTSQFASNWTGTVSTGKNKCHADCNGDGIVNSNDNAAISANYSLTHTFKSPSAAGVDIKIVAGSGIVNGGVWNKVDLVLGDPSNLLNQLYGVAFEINYDQAMIQNDSVKIIYTSSFLNASTQNIDFQKAYFNNGKLYCATVRTNGNNVNGNGKIAEVWFKVKNGIPTGSSINFSASNGKKISSSGLAGTLAAASAVSVSVSYDLVGLQNQNLVNSSVHLYPNPAKNSLTLENDLGTKTTYTLFDISGRLISKGEFTTTKKLDVSTFEAGTYMMEFESQNGKCVKKLVIEN